MLSARTFVEASIGWRVLPCLLLCSCLATADQADSMRGNQPGPLETIPSVEACWLVHVVPLTLDLQCSGCVVLRKLSVHHHVHQATPSPAHRSPLGCT